MCSIHSELSPKRDSVIQYFLIQAKMHPRIENAFLCALILYFAKP